MSEPALYPEFFPGPDFVGGLVRQRETEVQEGAPLPRHDERQPPHDRPQRANDPERSDSTPDCCRERRQHEQRGIHPRQDQQRRDQREISDARFFADVGEQSA